MHAGRYAVLATVFMVLALLQPPAAAPQVTTCDGGTYTANDTFQANLERLAASLPANASAAPSGFANNSAGAAPDQVYALALCRGDTNASTCSACVASAFQDARRGCPLYKGVTVYRDDCVLRFSGERFLGFLEPDQWVVSELVPETDTAPGSVNAPQAWFAAAVSAILTAVVDHAAAATSSNVSTPTRKYFATGEEDFDPKIYGLAQCALVLTPTQCRSCLGYLLWQATGYLSGRPQWISTFVVWCNLRYSVRPVYDGGAMLRLQAPRAPAAALIPGSATPESGAGKKKNGAAISAGAASCGVLLLILSAISVLLFQRRIKATKSDHPLMEISRAKCTIFDLPTLQEATENFSEKNKLGEGGFGTVYKLMLHNEVLLLAELQHKNLVRLQGFCSHQNDTLLVYEYIKNGSLDRFLFADANTGKALNWEQQHNIILGIAKGILYLHEDSSMRIIHRDLKTNNILLDDDMAPKIADFGLARLLGEGHTNSQTSRAAGTLGYMAPEYVMLGTVSPKIDIFSFGVLVLEIVTRRSNCSYDDHSAVNLLSDVWDYWTKGTISQMLDESLDGYSRSQALRCIHVGLLCVQADPDHRPHISSVIFMLTRDSMELQSPAQPAFFFGRESSVASISMERSSYVYDRSGSVVG
ncbi:hypothetical protein ACP70R_004478 [Stipagrostis hirtigluma subsp. patula]